VNDGRCNCLCHFQCPLDEPPKQRGVSLSDLTGLEQDSRSSVEGNEDNEKKFNAA